MKENNLLIPLHPRVPGVPLLAWVRDNVDLIKQRLSEHGVVLLRGFEEPLKHASQEVIRELGGELIEDVFWSTPRSRVASHTFTATEYPARSLIPLHSEMAYMQRYPRVLCFHAIGCATEGGQTTLANLDEVSRDLLELTDMFLRRRVKYTRVFRDGVDIPIATALGTSDRDQQQTIAMSYGGAIRYDGDLAILTHEARGAIGSSSGALWFNQIQVFHPARLPEDTRRGLVDLFGNEGLPRQVHFADGGEVSDEILFDVDRVLNQRTIDIEWQPGDVAVVDNLRFMHGRRPFVGPRTIHVAMGYPATDDTRRDLSSLLAPGGA